MNKYGMALAALFGLVAVTAGAMGDHWLQTRLPAWYPEEAAKRAEQWGTATRYLMYHALALGIVALWLRQFESTICNWSGWLFVAGGLMFSGCLMAYVLTGQKFLVHIVPLGGVSWMAGWFLLGLASIFGSRR